MKRGLMLLLVAAVAAGAALAKVDSGLDIGQKITAFLVKNCEGGDPYCQVCEYGKRPKLITVGDLGDSAWIEDLKAIQKLHEKYSKEGKGLGVFAVAAVISDGRAMPVAEPESALASLTKIKAENGLTFPLVIAQDPEAVYKAQGKKNPGYAQFEEYYRVTHSRTVMFGDSSNTVKFSAVLSDESRDSQIAALEASVKKGL